MNIILKCFITYSILSMLSAIFYVFIYGSIIGMYNINIGVFLLLWFTPLMITMSIGIPIGLWKMWNGDWKL